MQATGRTLQLAAVAIALAVSSLTANAQQPSAAALASANELIKVTSATTLFNPLIAGVVEQAKNFYVQQNPVLANDLNEIATKMRADLAPRFSELINEVARLYAIRFTEQELKDILAFYKSSSGQKMLSEQPKVVEASLQFAQSWSNKLSDEVIGKMREELKKRGKIP